jgi:ubiquinone/menaquinone biosynthesis C-methylase UbiE
MESEKDRVREFWNEASCGEALYLTGSEIAAYEAQASKRYELEPYIETFARFPEAAGKRVLEIGVGLGADHQRFAEAGADLHGIDLTDRAVQHTRQRLAARGLRSSISVGDAESLEFPDDHFDIVYSWGVLHHTPDTGRAVGQVLRVLKPGGRAFIMIYHKWSLIGLMLWVRYALLRLRPWMSLRDVYSRYLESPGTKAYTVEEARQLFNGFASVEIQTVLTHGDLLASDAGQRHGGVLLSMARLLWPRFMIRRLAPGMGLFMLISARK